jgi:TRAP-type mannitol/chloroaromatic compound transport system substrate-binding protein
MTQHESKQVQDKQQGAGLSRRRFIGTAVAGSAALGFPTIVRAQSTINWRFQSTWPAKFIYHEFAVDWTKKVEELSGGKLKIEMLSAGAVVPGLQIIDAASKGVLDGGHGIPGFWFGKNTAFGLYGAGPDFGMDANQMLGWIEYGGGKELFAEIQKAANLELVSFLFGPVPCEPFGWFKKEIKGPADLKGLKFRTAGLAVDMFKELGVSAVQMAPADIVPAIDRGVLDGAEFASATDDRVMGFPDVAKFYLQQSYHMSNNFCEVMINRKRYDALPAELKTVLRHAAHAASADMGWKAMHRMSQDFLELQTEQKVKTYVTPKPILDAQLKAWNSVIERRSAENPLFAKVIESQKAWAKRVLYWHNQVQVDQKAAYAHYFGKGPLA